MIEQFLKPKAAKCKYIYKRTLLYTAILFFSVI